MSQSPAKTHRGFTTVAALPAGAGCKSARPAEVVGQPAPAIVAVPVTPKSTASHCDPTITQATMEALGRSLARMRGKTPGERQGFEPFEYGERS